MAVVVPMVDKAESVDKAEPVFPWAEMQVGTLAAAWVVAKVMVGVHACEVSTHCALAPLR